MTRATPLKPTTKALKALFFNAFAEFFLIISAFLEVTITSTKFIVVYRNPRCQVFLKSLALGVLIKLETGSKCTFNPSFRIDFTFIESDILFIDHQNKQLGQP
jgi:hypothetical protein